MKVLISIVHNHTKDGGVPIILQMQQEARLLLLLRGQLLCRLQYNCMYKLQHTTRTCIIQFAAELILIRSCGTTYYPFCKEVQHASFSLRYIQAREILSTRVLWASLMSRNLKPAVAPHKFIPQQILSRSAAADHQKLLHTWQNRIITN
jgi:hypothetical protein